VVSLLEYVVSGGHLGSPKQKNKNISTACLCVTPDPHNRPHPTTLNPHVNDLALFVLPVEWHHQAHDEHLMDDGDHLSDLDRMSDFNPADYLEGDPQDADHLSDGELEYLDDHEYSPRELSMVTYQMVADERDDRRGSDDEDETMPWIM
jgi:hypothetical protein